jgi:Pyridoxamine 5'-phosphate oxidase
LLDQTKIGDSSAVFYNAPMPIPPEFKGHKYLQLTTFRKDGTFVPTPVWFAEDNDKLYAKTRATSGKTKRIRNNPQARVAPCTIRGTVTGPEFPASARILPPEECLSGNLRLILLSPFCETRLSSRPSRSPLCDLCGSTLGSISGDQRNQRPFRGHFCGPHLPLLPFPATIFMFQPETLFCCDFIIISEARWQLKLASMVLDASVAM